MTDLIEEAEAMAERNEVAHRHFMNDMEGETIWSKNAALIRRMIAQMRQDTEYVAVERGGRIGKV